jgi:hypothetical protein
MSHPMTRRSVLKAAAAITSGGACGIATVSETPACFRHRGYLGWITDLATEPDPTAAWPSMRLDERLLEDYRQTFDLMEHLGFNEISIWGLYVSRSWPVDITSTVDPKRGAMVEKLIDEAHQRGIRVYSGLGVHSWGFEEIIRAHPELSRGNRQAMCASLPEAWDWMRRVVDFVFSRFPIDGVSMQSADQGRCRCEQCQAHTDAEYHALLNTRTAEYIRGRYRGKTIGVNSWGLGFQDENALPALVQMSKGIDYLIDVHDSSRRKDPAYRRKLIGALDCRFGTIGGPQVEPPQHWSRDRWFLPTPQRTARHLQQLFADGGRACEYFFHILANPGDEMSFWMAGKALSDPRASWETHLKSCVEELYGTTTRAACEGLAQVFLAAEEAYMRYLPPDHCGTISLEPLVSNRAGPPIYLTERLSESQRRDYRHRLESFKADVEKLAPEVPRKNRITRMIRCIHGCLGTMVR